MTTTYAAAPVVTPLARARATLVTGPSFRRPRAHLHRRLPRRLRAHLAFRFPLNRRRLRPLRRRRRARCPSSLASAQEPSSSSRPPQPSCAGMPNGARRGNACSSSFAPAPISPASPRGSTPPRKPRSPRQSAARFPPPGPRAKARSTRPQRPPTRWWCKASPCGRRRRRSDPPPRRSMGCDMYGLRLRAARLNYLGMQAHGSWRGRGCTCEMSRGVQSPLTAPPLVKLATLFLPVLDSLISVAHSCQLPVRINIITQALVLDLSPLCTRESHARPAAERALVSTSGSGSSRRSSPYNSDTVLYPDVYIPQTRANTLVTRNSFGTAERCAIFRRQARRVRLYLRAKP